MGVAAHNLSHMMCNHQRDIHYLHYIVSVGSKS